MEKVYTIGEFKFYPKQITAFEKGTEKNNFYYATDVASRSKTWKAYGVPLQFTEFIKRYTETCELLSFYELIKQGEPRLEYYDIDNETDKKPEEIFNEFINIYTNFLTIKGIKEYPEWIVTDSSKPKKVSIHLINRNRCFANEIIMKEWYAELKYFCDTHYPNNQDVFDTSVCSSNRCMRMINSTKIGQNRPLKRAIWYHKEEIPIENYFIQNIPKNIEVITEIQNKHEDTKKQSNDTEISVEDVEINSDNELDMLIKLIIECVNNKTHQLCDGESDKMKYETFRNFIFAVVNGCIMKNIDYISMINKYDLPHFYRHVDKFNKDDIMKSIYSNCENKKMQTDKKYSIKSLHYWARANSQYTKYFPKKIKVFPEIDMTDEYCFGEFARTYGGKKILYNSDEYNNLLNDFCRVVAIINDGSLMFYVKSDKLNLRLCDTIKFAVKIWIVKKNDDVEKLFVFSIKDAKDNFNVINVVPQYDSIKCKPFTGEKKRHNYFNTFGGFQGKYVEDYDIKKIDKILYHLKNIICSGNDEYYNYMLNWLACLIQKPDEKTGIGVFLQSVQGTGKGIFLSFLKKYVIGYQSVFSTTGLDKIVCRFNSHLDGKIFVEIDELQGGDVSAQSFHSAFDTVKNLISETQMSYEEKGQRVRDGENYLNFWITTNNKFSIKVEEHDRRYFPLEVSPAKVGDFDYFNQLKKDMTQENGNIFYSYLTDFKLNLNLRKIPKTAFKDELIENSKQIPELFIDEIKNGDYVPDKKYKDNNYPVSYIYDCFCSWCMKTGNKQMSLQKMSKILHTKMPTAFTKIYINKKQIRCILIK